MIKIGDIIDVAYLENPSSINNNYHIVNKTPRKSIKGKVIRVEECTTAIVQSRATNVFKFLDKLQSGKLVQTPKIEGVLAEIIKQRKENPEKVVDLKIFKDKNTPLDFSEDELETLSQINIFIQELNGLLRKFQVVLVEIAPEIRFWYLLKNCDSGSLLNAKSNDGEFIYKRHIPSGYINNDNNQSILDWYEEDIKFHNYCSQLEESIPGILTTIANWTKYGMMATGIRRFDIIEDLLRLPYVNRADLIPYFSKQYRQDYENFKRMQTPAKKEIKVFRGSYGYNKHHENFKVSTILATTNNPLVSKEFSTSEKGVKKFIIPEGYPIIDLREFNPREREIILLPPISFKIEAKGTYKHQRSGNTFYNTYSIKQNGKGRRNKQNIKGKKTRRHKKQDY